MEYNEIQVLNSIMAENAFGNNTCFDYVDSIKKRGDVWQVTVFVEPAGYITKSGEKLIDVLEWWYSVFDLQPATKEYAEAGWHLWALKDKIDNLSPTEIWGKLIPTEEPAIKGNKLLAVLQFTIYNREGKRKQYGLGAKLHEFDGCMIEDGEIEQRIQMLFKTMGRISQKNMFDIGLFLKGHGL